jgi:hypothetical protein
MDEIWGTPLVFRGLRLAEQADPAGEPPMHAWRGRAAAEVVAEP